jgi:hypothetical protein
MPVHVYDRMGLHLSGWLIPSPVGGRLVSGHTSEEIVLDVSHRDGRDVEGIQGHLVRWALGSRTSHFSKDIDSLHGIFTY